MSDKYVVVIDDSSDVLFLVERILTNGKINHVTASSGEMAIEKINGLLLENKTIACIVLDIMMPDINGIVFLKNLKMRPELRNIPVIMCTSVSDKEKILDAKVYGAVGYILKPIKPDTYIKKLNEYLN